MSNPSSVLEADGMPGWFGKLPGIGDFAYRRLPEVFRAAWDRWLQAGMARLRARHADWTERYLKAPLWFFVLGDGVIGNQSWLGVLMPSVDAVGRYFPLTVADELVWAPTELHGQVLARAQQWWALAAQAAFDGLEQDLDAVRFEARLLQLFSGEAVAGGGDSASAMALPEFGQSLWFIDPAGEAGPGMATHGLPQDEQFDALFGFAAGAPAQGTEAK
ncbi:type VI secretion system-associated protein TagF [Variovorax sp. SRS16]|uniref:type VI secretion system-associated protein TagF n=1 Tax=Variovorax sp. SRS16 TaxID=282217 RepID=UPI001E45C519|nr:type VI secretion system-associated protein TagF [Variovorax sp. SRS16]